MTEELCDIIDNIDIEFEVGEVLPRTHSLYRLEYYFKRTIS